MLGTKTLIFAYFAVTNALKIEQATTTPTASVHGPSSPLPSQTTVGSPNTGSPQTATPADEARLSAAIIDHDEMMARLDEVEEIFAEFD
jgi:hypothetical protein